MKIYVFFLTILIGLLFVACGGPPDIPISPSPTPTNIVAATIDGPTATTPPELDAYSLGLALVNQAAASLPDGWRLFLCTDGGAPLCWQMGEVTLGGASLEIRDIADYDETSEWVQLAAGLPAPGTPFSAATETAVQAALTRFAAVDLQAKIAYETENDPACMVTELPIEPGKMGPLPAVTYGYSCTNKTGQLVDHSLWAFALDQQHTYGFVSIIAPPPSGLDITHYTAVFNTLITHLPLYDPTLIGPSVKPGETPSAEN